MSEHDNTALPLSPDDLRVIVGVLVNVSAYYYVDEKHLDPAQFMGKIADRFGRDVTRLQLTDGPSRAELQQAASDLVERVRAAIGD